MEHGICFKKRGINMTENKSNKVWVIIVIIIVVAAILLWRRFGGGWDSFKNILPALRKG